MNPVADRSRYADSLVLEGQVARDLIAHLRKLRGERVRKEWDESQHPRVPAGSGDESGEWTSGGGGGGGSSDGHGSLPSLDDVASTWILGDMAPKGRAIVEQTLREVYRDYELPRLSQVQASDLDQPASVLRPKPTAADRDNPHDDTMLMQIGTRFFKDGQAGLDRGRAKLMALQRKNLARLERMGEMSHREAMNHLKRVTADSSKRWVDFTLPGVIRHELGHVAEVQIIGTKPYREAMRTWKRDAAKLSLRATEYKAEYVAEAFGAYLIGKPINRRLADAFHLLKRAS